MCATSPVSCRARTYRAVAMLLDVINPIAGSGIVYLFEDWLRPHLDSGKLEPVLKPWWPRFPGPFLYYPGRRLVPAPLRAFVDFIKAQRQLRPVFDGLATGT